MDSCCCALSAGVLVRLTRSVTSMLCRKRHHDPLTSLGNLTVRVRAVCGRKCGCVLMVRLVRPSQCICPARFCWWQQRPASRLSNRLSKPRSPAAVYNRRCRPALLHRVTQVRRVYRERVACLSEKPFDRSHNVPLNSGWHRTTPPFRPL